MCGFTIGDGFSRDMIQVIFDEFCDEIDDSLYFLSSGE
jgi:hypothetical protein